MAARKFFHPARPVNPELVRLIEAARKHVFTAEELDEQRISFAYGNSLAEGETSTKESVRAALKQLRLVRK